MNILYIAHEGGNDFNGASRSLLSIIDYFSKNNNVFVVIPYNYGRLFEELKTRNCTVWIEDYTRWINFRFRNPIKIGKQRLTWYLKDKKANYLVCNKMEQRIHNNKIDIIHSNSSVIDLGAHLHLNTDVPHIWHFREFAQEDFNMWPLVNKKEYSKMINQGCNKIITVSKAVEEKYKPIVREGSTRTIYNGIEMSNNLNKIQKKQRSNFNILVTGMISEAKGQRIAVKAVSNLLDAGYSNVHLYVAGNGSLDEVAPEYGKYIDNIHCLGVVEDMVKLRNDMNVEIVCSKAEAFGRVTVEAMYSQLPVIGSNSGGTAELIKDGFTGYLFEPGNYIQLEHSLQILINNPKLCSVLGKNGYDYVTENFSIERCTLEIEEVYKELVFDKIK